MQNPLNKGLPQVPDPTKIANSGVNAAKAVAKGAQGVGENIFAGAHQILFNTSFGLLNTIHSTAKELAALAQSDIQTGVNTVEGVMSQIDRAGNELVRELDQAIGGEIVRKFKSEVERYLR